MLVFFGDVEKAIATIPGVETVAVVARGETLRGKGIIAYCTLTPGKSLNQEEIQTACFEILPRRAIPDRICILEALPLLPTGKVDLQKLVDTATSVNKNK
ncbi:AMP-binding enzyme [Limnofasciculus baicalensis]|uniref:AMP-binding enzyme n=1 Tax=Limnofasciculus baicalensis TaxID=3064906 RepID=UPI0020A7B707|nr:hypothetical protein [Limnofasciculus baicalensis]